MLLIANLAKIEKLRITEQPGEWSALYCVALLVIDQFLVSCYVDGTP